MQVRRYYYNIYIYIYLLIMMTQEISAFQARFPLSAKKFSKKLLGKMFGSILVVIFWTISIGFFLFTLLPLLPSNPFFHASYEEILFLAVILWIILTLLYAMYLRTYIRRYFYDANENFITIKKGVFAPSEIHVQYQKIQDVYVDQDILDRIFGIYDVHLASATSTSSIEAHIDGVDTNTANALRDYLLSKISGHSVSANMVTAVPERTIPADVSSDAFPIEARYYAVVLLRGVITTGVLSAAIVFAIFKTWNLSAFVVVALALYVVTIVVQAIRLSTFRFVFTQDHLMMRTGFLATTEKHVPYQTVQDVILNQDFFDRLFGTCSVIIENATAIAVSRRGRARFSGIMIPGQTLERGKKLIEIINSITSKNKSFVVGL